MRLPIAFARASIPSHRSLVEAPVMILILNGSPWACSFSALAAMAWVTTFGEPGAVNPEKPQWAPSKNNSAASSGVIMGNLIILF